ncbi:MAG TPA: hypothetical protein VGG16_27210 [Streptosporangiaceae bacterium]|jgi:hypothetical protein
MRVYLPSTLPGLARVLQAGQIDPVTAYAVTPALREAYSSGDTEELEYVALLAAARASLGLLAADPQAPPRRVVLAAEVPDAAAIAAEHPAAVTIAGPIPIAKLAAAHVDDDEAAQDVAKAVAALPAAEAGDEDAEFDVDEAEGHELAWYATQELPHLLG